MNKQIGPYQIIREVGRGGMGVVHLARDTRLDREVAIKELPEHFAQDPLRLERFEREAKALAALSHVNLAGIYGVEEQDGGRYLVLEYVEGETLADRLDRGALPLDEALELAVQIAAGVEAAHDAGIVHRDLKPDNIKLTPEGKAKVLDFGLARADESGTSSSGSGDTATKTAAQRTPTIEGAILGTAAYMSPEQARGRRVDKRTDLWSYGVVVYEMLVGASPFHGETTSDSIGAVLHKDIDLSLLPAGTPPMVRHVLARCLERNREKRYRDIGDVRIELERARTEPHPDEETGGRRPPQTVTAGVALVLTLVAGLVLGAAGWKFLGPSTTPAPQEVSRLSITLQPDQELDEVVISADGRAVAYIARDTGDGEKRLWVRSLDNSEASLIPDTERVNWAAFSPDGRWLAYHVADELSQKAEIKKVSLDGGPAVSLVRDISPGDWMDGLWTESGDLLYSDENELTRVSANGGQPETLLDPDAEGETSLVLAAHPLPDGERLVVVVGYLADGGLVTRTEIFTPASGDRRVLIERGSAGIRTPNGYLIFGKDGGWFAVPFDPNTARLTGPEVPLMSDAEEVGVSRNGTLVYTVSSRRTSHLARVDREGATERIEAVDAAIPDGGGPIEWRWSPDGSRLALTIWDSDKLKSRLWVHEPRRGAPAPLDTPGMLVNIPVWSRDGAHVMYTAGASEGGWRMYRRAADGSDTPVPLFEEDDPKAVQIPEEVTPDGSLLVFTRSVDGPADLWAIPASGGKATPLIATSSDEKDARISRDGRWIAYVSDRSGRNEVWVSPLPAVVDRPVEQRVRVSVEGGQMPCWSADGSELFFIQGDLLMSAALENVGESGLPAFGPPRRVLDRKALGLGDLRDVHPEDGRFFFNTLDDEQGHREIHVVLNWLEELKRRTSN
jgi:serine/threonine protein kinase